MNRILGIGIVLAILAYFSQLFYFVVDQRQIGVLKSFGKVEKVLTEPGFNLKLPDPIQNVVYLDKRILTLDSGKTSAIQTAEKKNLIIDWLVKWRIVDAKKFIQTQAQDADIRQAERRLSSIVQDAFNTEVTQRTVGEVITTEREEVMQQVKARLLSEVDKFGIEIVDVRLKRVDFPSSVAKRVYDRMASERKQVANELRSTGEAESEEIRAQADRQQQEILAKAYRDAEIVRGEADGKAAEIFAKAYGKDPEFAKFYRSIEAYQSSLGKKGDVMVIDPSSEFFDAMRGER